MILRLPVLTVFFALLFITLAQSETSTVTTKENKEHKNAVPENRDYFDDLEGDRNCLYEIEGTLDGVGFNEAQSVVQCEQGVKWCQRVSAHYISVSFHHDTITKIVMRGCDNVTVPGYPQLYDGIVCEKNGCTEVTDNSERYMVCCCNTDFCNTSSTSFTGIIVFILTFLLAYG